MAHNPRYKRRENFFLSVHREIIPESSLIVECRLGAHDWVNYPGQVSEVPWLTRPRTAAWKARYWDQQPHWDNMGWKGVPKGARALLSRGEKQYEKDKQQMPIRIPTHSPNTIPLPLILGFHDTWNLCFTFVHYNSLLLYKRKRDDW